MKKRLSFLLMAALLLVVTAVITYSSVTSSNHIYDSSADSCFVVLDTNSENYHLCFDDLQEVTVFHFWESNCRVCLHEVFHKKEIYLDLAASYPIINISLERHHDDWMKFSRMVQHKNIQNFRLKSGWEDQLALQYKIKGVPAWVVISNDSILLRTHNISDLNAFLSKDIP